MKVVTFFLLLLAVSQTYASGPTLGTATKVVVTEVGVDSERPSDSFCKEFKLNSTQAAKFLNNAVIVTPYEMHNCYDTLPCYVRGTAEFRGNPASWEIRAGGTGSITFWLEFHYLLAEKQECHSN